MPKSEKWRESVEEHFFKAIGDEPMADAAVCVRLPRSVDAAVRALGDERSAWMRRVISDAAKAELLKG